MFTGRKALDNFKDFMQDFRDVLTLRQWRSAANHYCGAGLENGVDCASYRTLLKQLEETPQY
eukprot:7110141-Pyramimonas_sp.AAC.1